LSVKGQLDGTCDLADIKVDDASVTLEYGVHSVPPCVKYVCCGRDFWRKKGRDACPSAGTRHGEMFRLLSKSPIERSIRIPQSMGFVKTKTTKY
jgi:hypothetical protein